MIPSLLNGDFMQAVEGGGLVTFPSAWEALGGLRLRSGKHPFIVGSL